MFSKASALFLLILISSCGSGPSGLNAPNSESSSKTKKVEYFDVNIKNLTYDFMTWYTYTYDNIKLARDFIALDADSSEISKEEFLNKLLTGEFIALNSNGTFADSTVISAQGLDTSRSPGAVLAIAGTYIKTKLNTKDLPGI